MNSFVCHIYKLANSLSLMFLLQRRSVKAAGFNLFDLMDSFIEGLRHFMYFFSDYDTYLFSFLLQKLGILVY